MSTAVTPLPTSISLYYKDGSSDKEYHTQIKGDEANGYIVHFQYGRVGNKLSVGTKNKMPVDLKTAQIIFTDLVKEKMSKGYQSKEGSAPGYQNPTSEKKMIGVLPQLLNSIEEEQVTRYLNDDCCIMQEKKDGVRSMIVKKKKVVEGSNRKGEVTSLPTSVEQAISKACGNADAITDGELVGEVYWLFDLLSIGVHAYANKPYEERLEAIKEWLGDSFSEHFQFVPTAVTKEEKKKLYAKLKREGAEGVVFKRLDAPYKAGRPASGGSQVKFKFYATASFRVKAINVGKRSVQMEILNGTVWEGVESVTIPVNQEIPEPGSIIEVRYLYAYPQGGLAQPICLGVRTDIDDTACVKSQLKYKQGSKDDDES